jgi:hypothetical protein
MRQVMPHRNNMSLHRNKCKIFLLERAVIAEPATNLQQPAPAIKFAEAENVI